MLRGCLRAAEGEQDSEKRERSHDGLVIISLRRARKRRYAGGKGVIVVRILGLVLGLAGCVAAPDAATQGPGIEAYRAAIEANEAPFRVPGTVTARLNQEVQIGDVRVKPLEVLEDSRCPVDANCIWAGRVRLRVAVSGAGEQVMEVGRPVNVAGGQRLTLVGVAPLNWARRPAGINPNTPKRFAFSLSGMD